MSLCCKGSARTAAPWGTHPGKGVPGMVSPGRGGAAALGFRSGTREGQPFEHRRIRHPLCTFWLPTQGVWCCTEVSAVIPRRRRGISATDFTTTFNLSFFFARFLDQHFPSLIWLYGFLFHIFHLGHRNGLHCCPCGYQWAERQRNHKRTHFADLKGPWS